MRGEKKYEEREEEKERGRKGRGRKREREWEGEDRDGQRKGREGVEEMEARKTKNKSKDGKNKRTWGGERGDKETERGGEGSPIPVLEITGGTENTGGFNLSLTRRKETRCLRLNSISLETRVWKSKSAREGEGEKEGGRE